MFFTGATDTSPLAEWGVLMSWSIERSRSDGQGTEMSWRDRARCRAEDPELFFPVGSSGPALAQLEDAKAVCRRCPVAVECLAWALATGQTAGVWGGLSEDERRELRRTIAASTRGVLLRIEPGRWTTRMEGRAG